MNVSTTPGARAAAVSDPLLADNGPHAIAVPPSRFDEDLSFVKRVWFFARRNARLIALGALLGLLAAASMTAQRTTRYTATAEVLIDPTDTTTFGLDAESGTLGSDEVTLQTQMRIARSVEVARAAVARLGLVEQIANSMPSATSSTKLAPVLQPLAELLERLPADFLLATGLASDQLQLEVVENDEAARRAALDYVIRGLGVYQSDKSLILEFSFTSLDQQEAARVVNAVAESYIDHQFEQKLRGTTRTTTFLEARLGELDDQLRAAEEAIRRYRSDNQMVATSGRTLSEQELSTLTDELIEVRATREDLQGRIGYLRNLRGRGDALETVGEIVASPLVAALLQEHITLKRREAELRAIYGERHPLVVAVRADLTDIVRQIGDEADRHIASLDNEISLLGARERAIREQMSRATADNVRLSQAEIGLRELERNAEALRGLYNAFLVRYTEAREQRQVIEPDARIITRAEAPSAPSSRGFEVWLFIGFVLGGGVGVGISWLRESFDRGLRTRRDVEHHLGLPCLGQVPLAQSLGEARLRPHAILVERPRSAYAEAVRSIATILTSNDTGLPKVIQVSSALPAEGKTAFAASLAHSLASTGHDTLLVDLDLHHPSVGRELGIEPERCLVDFLLGEASLDLVLQQPQPGLTVLPVRRVPPDPAALINSRRLRELLEQLRGEFEQVILDTPPLLLVTDPKTTARLADTTILLVRWQETSRSKAANALVELEAVGAHVAGAVLSQVDLRQLEQYGYAGVGTYVNRYKSYYQKNSQNR